MKYLIDTYRATIGAPRTMFIVNDEETEEEILRDAPDDWDGDTDEHDERYMVEAETPEAAADAFVAWRDGGKPNGQNVWPVSL